MQDKAKDFTDKYLALCKEYGLQIGPVLQLQLVPFVEQKVEESKPIEVVEAEKVEEPAP